MSIWTTIQRGLGVVGDVLNIGQALNQPPLPGLPPGGFTTGGTLPPLPGGGGNQVIIRPTRLQPGMTAMGCPVGYHPAKDGSGRWVKNRRMNVLNPRAARRAIRRIKGARKMLHSIERSLPTRTVHRRTR